MPSGFPDSDQKVSIVFVFHKVHGVKCKSNYGPSTRIVQVGLFVQLGFLIKVPWELWQQYAITWAQALPPSAVGAGAGMYHAITCHPPPAHVLIQWLYQHSGCALHGSLQSNLAGGCSVKYYCRILACLKEGNWDVALLKHTLIIIFLPPYK